MMFKLSNIFIAAVAAMVMLASPALSAVTTVVGAPATTVIGGPATTAVVVVN
ncbi:hypothetical protein BDZ89DRAFT_1154821 [Hymenopellis radicata]|nr:hypothetical protein BDZ89DRAFT_1154821 [Hymenopellis radicata]